MSNNKAITRSTKSSKSTSEDGSDSQISLQHILSKLEEIEKTSNNQHQTLLTAINKINKRLDALESEQTRVIECLDYMSNDVDDLKKGYAHLKTVVAKLEESNTAKSAQDRDVTQTVDRIEHEKNLKTLLVANIPSSQHEDTTKIITNLAAKLETSMLPGDIDSAFRIKSDAAAHSSKPALIMVKFTNTASRDRFYNARKNFNKLSITTQSIGFRRKEKIFINEALTRSQRALFFKARQMKVKSGWRYVWTFHGQVYMRKSADDDPVKITSEETLSNLMATTSNHDG